MDSGAASSGDESSLPFHEQPRELNSLHQAESIGLAVLDRELRIVRVNSLLAKLSGKPVDELVGLTVREVLPDLAPAVEPTSRKVFESGEAVLDIEVQLDAAARPGTSSFK